MGAARGVLLDGDGAVAVVGHGVVLADAVKTLVKLPPVSRLVQVTVPR